MEIPQYLSYPDKESERSKLYNYLINHENHKLTIEKVDKIIKKEEMEKKIIKGNVILNSLGIYDEKMVPYYDKNELEYKIYLNNKFPNLSKREKEILIEHCIDKLKEYLQALTLLLFNKRCNFDSERKMTPHKQDIYRYMQIRNDTIIECFFKAIKLNIIQIGKNILSEDREILKSRYGALRYNEEDYLSRLFLYCKIQFEYILEIILPVEKEIEDNPKNTIYGKSIALIIALEETPAYTSFMRALNDNLIILNEDKKFDFQMGTGAICHFLKTGGFNQWELLRNHSLSNGRTISDSIRTATETKEATKILKKYYSI